MRDTFTQALKDAMKGGDKRRVSTLRLIQSALKDKDIEARGLGKGQATDEDVLALLQKMLKQREESLAIYTQAGRTDLADQEREEADIIRSYLPTPLDDAAVNDAIAAAIAETNASSIKDMGKVIAILKSKYSGQMDFAKASGLVKTALAG